MSYFLTPFSVLIIIIVEIDPTVQFVEELWHYFPFLKMLALKIVFGSELMFSLGVGLARYFTVLGVIYEIERLGLWFGALGLYAVDGFIHVFRMKLGLMMREMAETSNSQIRWYSSVRIMFQTPVPLLVDVAGLGSLAGKVIFLMEKMQKHIYAFILKICRWFLSCCLHLHNDPFTLVFAIQFFCNWISSWFHHSGYLHQNGWRNGHPHL